MVAGSTVRNLVLGIVYFLTMPIWLAFFPFVLGLFVWRNTSGWADGLTALPGVSAGGGLAAFAYGFRESADLLALSVLGFRRVSPVVAVRVDSVAAIF